MEAYCKDRIHVCKLYAIKKKSAVVIRLAIAWFVIEFVIIIVYGSFAIMMHSSTLNFSKLGLVSPIAIHRGVTIVEKATTTKSASCCSRTSTTPIQVRSLHILHDLSRRNQWRNVNGPMPIVSSRHSETTTSPCSTSRSFAAANRGGGGTGTMKSKKGNKKKKGKRSNNVPSLLTDFEPAKRGRGGRAKKGHSDDLVAIRSMFDSLLMDSDDDDEDEEVDFNDDDDDFQSKQWYEKAVQALQTDADVRLNLGAPVRVGPITSQASTTEFHRGKPQTSHQYSFGVTGTHGRATARLNLVHNDANVELELFGGQVVTISLNTVAISSSSTTTIIEGTATSSTSRPFSPPNRWNDDDDVIEAEIVEKIPAKKEHSID